jgi:tetratricopeptide (TPR) repeat protein
MQVLTVTPPAIQVQPLFEQAVTLHRRGQFDQAKALYEQILQLEPRHFDATHLLGLMACQQKDHAAGLPLIHQAIAINPQNAGPYSNLGVIYKELKQFDEALKFQSKAIELDPGFSKAYFNRGNLHKALKQQDLAIQDYNKALELNPQDAEALVNRALVYFELKNYSTAEKDLDRAIEINPHLGDAHFNRGLLMTRLLKFDQALISYRNTLVLTPNFDFLLGEKLYSQLFCCDWSDFEEHAELLKTRLAQHQKVSAPLIASGVLDSPLHQQIAAQIWVEQTYPENQALGPLQNPSSDDIQSGIHRKIRIGYVSADFHDHPVSILLAELFELHDKTRFELIAFDSTQEKPHKKDTLRERIKSAFDEFISIKDLDDKSAAELMRAKHLDVAIDLGGHTLNSRLGTLAYRVAPVQLSYVGYLGTLGAPYIDYILADDTLIPEKNQSFYTEQLLYLPCYQVNDRKREISSRVFKREELGLPETGFVYCCFNNNYKISPSTFAAWMTILKSVPGSVLWLLADNPTAQTNLTNHAALHGVDPGRLIFGGRLEASEYLARYKTADLFLDTWPYNAGTTATDALLVGLPVLTRMGESFASRMASSVLMGLDLPELITQSIEEYQQRAIELALNLESYQVLRDKVSNNRINSRLFNPVAFTTHLEDGLIYALKHAQSGRGPKTFHVKEQVSHDRY